MNMQNANITANVVQVRQYLDMVNPQGGGGYVGVADEKGWHQTYARSPNDALRIIQQEEARGPLGVFLSQATFKSNKSREALNANTFAGLFVDLDTGSDSLKKYPFMYQAAVAQKQIQEDFLPSSAVVCSGGGMHGYWQFNTSISLQEWKPLAEAFKCALQANGIRIDPAVTADAARVLRVPGTVNRKHGERPCLFTSFHPDRTYSVATIKAAIEMYAAKGSRPSPDTPLNALPAPTTTCDGVLPGSPPRATGGASVTAALAGWPTGVIEPAAEGSRNSALCSFLGRAYNAGHSPETIRAAAMEWNSRCTPPMDDDEVERTVRSMWKTHCSNHADDAEHSARREVQRRENAAIGAGEAFDPLPEVLTCNEMLERFIFLADGSRVFDKKHPKHVLSLSDFRNSTAASVSNGNTGVFSTDGKAKTKRIANSQTWMDSPQRLSAIGTTFNASAGMYAKDPSGRHCVNVWTGFDRSVHPGDADIALVLEQIRWLFKDRADDFLDWLAHIEQQPGVLPHTAWLHISSFTGTGRNAIARLLSRVFPGYAAMSLALERLLDSGFNDELSAKVLAVVDEIRVGGRDQWRHTETLKQMISAQVRHINVKYGRKSVEVNACRFLVFSNHRNAIPIDDTDRRVEVVICDDAPKAEAYYTELYRDVDDKHVVAAFAKFLRHRDISAFNPGRHAVKSADKEQVVAVTGSEEYAALREFTKTYAPPLVTYDRLAKAAGVSAFSGDARRFAHAVLEAGWQRVGRTSTKGQRVVIYAKSAFAAQWISKKEAFAEGLPVCDGGNVDWTEGE
jgi:hypothetical protein